MIMVSTAYDDDKDYGYKEDYKDDAWMWLALAMAMVMIHDDDWKWWSVIEMMRVNNHGS